jgi:nucleotide-binding universal stress UspA family protein
MYEKILVPLDGSKNAERALHQVEMLAVQNSSEVVLLMAVPLKGRAASEHDAKFYLDSFERQKIETGAYIEAIKTALMQKNVKARGIIEYKDTIEATIAIVADEKPDLIAISTKGKKSFVKLLNKVSTPILFVSG